MKNSSKGIHTAQQRLAAAAARGGAGRRRERGAAPRCSQGGEQPRCRTGVEEQQNGQQLLVFNWDHPSACKSRDILDCSGLLRVQVEVRDWEERGHSAGEVAQ